jgi:hypothetical protein
MFLRDFDIFFLGTAIFFDSRSQKRSLTPLLNEIPPQRQGRPAQFEPA